MLRVNSQSLEFVKVPVFARKAGIAYDPSSDVVKMTFVQSETLPANPTWYTATWEDTTGGHMARCLVGPSPGVVQLLPDHDPWYVFVQITDNPEVPVIEAGPIEVY